MEQIVDGLGKLVEGFNSVEAALHSNRVNEIIILNRKIKSKKIESLVGIAKKKKLKIREVKNKKEWDYNSRHSVVALCKPLVTYRESDIAKFKGSDFLVCDHIQDTNNLGAVVRSASAFGFNVLAIPLKRSVKLSEKVFSISSGGLEKVNIFVLTRKLILLTGFCATTPRQGKQMFLLLGIERGLI